MNKRRLILGVDFDGTCTEHMYPAIGPEMQPMKDELLEIEKLFDDEEYKKEYNKWRLVLSGCPSDEDRSIRLQNCRSTSDAILESDKIIEENNYWHYGSAVLISDNGYEYDLHMDRMKKASRRQFCYCGRAIDETNSDCVTYSLCKDHAMDA